VLTASSSVGGLEAGWLTRVAGIQRLSAGLDTYHIANPGKGTALFNYIVIFGVAAGAWLHTHSFESVPSLTPLLSAQ
jgi:hypothetical protein